MATGWWGGFTDQISSMAKDVLNEGTEEVDDHATALQQEQKKTAELQSLNTAVKLENDSLRLKVSELNDSLHSSELQVAAINTEYKSLLQDKEEEVKGLKRTVEELNESNRTLLTNSTASAPTERSHFHHFNHTSSPPNDGLFDESEDLLDSVFHQQEINRLNSELERCRAECLALKRVSTPQTPVVQGAINEDQGPDSVQALKAKLKEASDRHRKELENLERFHREEINDLQASFAQQQIEKAEQLKTEYLKNIDELRQQHEHSTAAATQQHELLLGNLETQISQLEVEKRDLVEELEDAKRGLTSSIKETGDFGRKIEEDGLSSTAEKDAIPVLSDEASGKQAELESAQQELSLLRQQLAEGQAEAEELRLQTEEFRLQVEELRGDNSALDHSLVELNQEHEAILEQLIQQRDELKSQNRSLLEEVKAKPSDSPEIAELKLKLEKASFSLNELHMDKSEVQKELDMSKAKLKVVADKYKELLSKHRTAAAELEEAKEEVTTLKMAAASIDISQPVTSGCDEGQLEQLTTANRELEVQVTQIQDELMAAKRSLASASQFEARIGELTDLLDQSEDNNKQLENEISQLECKVGQLESDIVQSEDTVKQLESERSLLDTSKDATTQLEVLNEDLKLKNTQLMESQHMWETRVSETEAELRRHVELETNLQERLSQSLAECANLQQSNSDLHQQLSVSQVELEELRVSDSKVRDDLNIALADVEQLKSSEAKLSASLAQSHTDLTSKEQTEVELKGRVAQLEEVLADLREQLAQSALEVSQFENTISTLQRSEQDLKERLIVVETSLQLSSQSQHSDVEQMQQLTTDKENLQTQVELLMKERDELTNKHELTLQQLESASNEITMLKMSAAVLDVSDYMTSSLSGGQTHQDSEVVKCEKDLEEVRKMLGNKELEIEDLKQALAQSESRIGELQDDINQSQLSCEQSRTSMNELERKIQELDLSVSELRTENSELVEKLNKSEEELKIISQSEMKLKLSHSNLEAELVQLRQSEAELKDLLIQSETEIQELKKTESATSTIQSLTADKELLETELKQCQEELLAAKRLEASQSSLQQSLDVSEAQRAELTDLYQTAQAKNEDLLAQLELKCEELNASLNQISQIEQDVQKSYAERDALALKLSETSALSNSKTSELEAEISQLQTSLSEHEKEALQTINSLNQQLQDANDRIVHMKERLEAPENVDQDHSLSSEAVGEEELATDSSSVEGLGADADQSPYSAVGEVLELKNQLAELQEILASKVLLINELQDASKSLENDKLVLTQQVGAFQADRELLVSTLQTKHQEATRFHAEAVRLTDLLKERETLLTASAAAGDSQKDEELEALRSRLGKLKQSLLEKDKMHEDIQLRLSSQSESLSLAQTECQTLRKQIENLTFELSATRAENDDRGEAVDKYRAQLTQQDTLVKTLRTSELEFQRTIKDKEREIAQLSSQASTSGVTSDAEKEKLTQTIFTLTSERDSAHHTAQQNYMACQDLQTSLSEAIERATKLEREVDRLRSHLVSIEEGYTADLLQSEEREKDLRNRLALAEEKAASTSTAVQHASLEASKEICSLEEQLHSVASQRDSLTLQLSNAQEQCSQYAVQLQNLQLVLEQFQREKDSMHAAEVQKLTSKLTVSQSAASEMEAELIKVQGQLDSQVEALEAAQRLTLQLEKKEEAMDALRGEVDLRENQLRDAEDRIKRLSFSNESKVEKLLVKNLLINHISAPASKKLEVLRLIASVLGFTQADKDKVGLGSQSGWIGGLWQKLAHPSAKPLPDESFSELFVKFLETESSPKPPPLPLPVDKMVDEERRKADQHHRQAFNPFLASADPKTVSNQSQQPRQQPSQTSFPLIVGSTRESSPMFTNNQPLPMHTLSATTTPLTSTPSSTPVPTTTTLFPLPPSASTLIPKPTSSSTLIPGATELKSAFIPIVSPSVSGS